MNWFRFLSGRPAADADAAPAAQRPPTPDRAADAFVVIDVRSEGEFQRGAVQGAISLPLGRLAQDIRHVVPDKQTPVLLYCASGARSGMGCTLLRGMGYRSVDNAGGVFAAAARLNRGLG